VKCVEGKEIKNLKKFRNVEIERKEKRRVKERQLSGRRTFFFETEEETERIWMRTGHEVVEERRQVFFGGEGQR